MIATKKPVAWWWWPIWWVAILVGDLLFYVLITPIWLGLRWLAWIAEFRSRRRSSVRRRETPKDRRYVPFWTQLFVAFEYSSWRK